MCGYGKHARRTSSESSLHARRLQWNIVTVSGSDGNLTVRSGRLRGWCSVETDTLYPLISPKNFPLVCFYTGAGVYRSQSSKHLSLSILCWNRDALRKSVGGCIHGQARPSLKPRRKRLSLPSRVNVSHFICLLFPCPCFLHVPDNALIIYVLCSFFLSIRAL